MANVQIYRFEFVANNPYGEFVAGDVVDIYMETDDTVIPALLFDAQSTGITVYKNGVILTSSIATMPTTGSGVITRQDFNVSYCIATTYVSFLQKGNFPFVFYVTYADHNSCSVVPVVCDLMILGSPEVIPASDATTADGSITVTATSSNPIQYKIGSDFTYNDGSGQTSNVFNGLFPGNHRVYLRDSKNCAANVLVVVGVNNTFGTILRLEYDDLNGVRSRADITKRGYSGGITEIEADTQSPVMISLRGEGSLDKFETLLSSQLVINLSSQTDTQFRELYTNDRNLFRIDFSKKNNNATSSVILPALSSWSSGSSDANKPDWTTGSTPTVTLPGSGALNIKTSEYLYTDFVFSDGTTYTISLTFTRTPNGPQLWNPRTAHLKVTDGLFVTQFSASKVANEGVNTVNLTFLANASCSRIIFYYTSGSNVIVEVNSITAESNGFQRKLLTKVLPQQYMEEWAIAPFGVSITATDGLPELSRYYLIQDDGQKYFGTISVIKLVSYCLGLLKLDLPIRVACNLYAEDMDQGDSDDPLDQAYIDYERFYLASKDPTIDFVLRSVLEPFGVRLTQWDGRWNIIRVEEMASSYDYRDFDKDGNFVSYGTFNPVVDIDYTDNTKLLLANQDHSVETRPGYGYIKMIYELGLKLNILDNGDFRLRSAYWPEQQQYFFFLNKDGWLLVNGGYNISETFESIDENNVAYKLTSGEDSLYNPSAGSAYIQSGTYFVKMGTNNQLKIIVRYKVDRVSAVFGTSTYTVEVPYIKVRVRVKYGSLYLQSDGTWSASENILTFFASEFGKFTEAEIIAKQPNSGTPVAGMDLDVRVYHAHAYYAQFQSIANLKAFSTYDSGSSAQLIPTGYRTELRDSFSFPSYMYYYELVETTEAENGYLIVRPTDYHGTNNARQWVLQKKQLTTIVSGSDVFPFSIDRVQVTYLTDNKDPIDAIIRSKAAESSNNEVFEKTLIFGSFSNLVVTEQYFGIDLGIFFPKPGLVINTVNILSFSLIYTGYYRSATGDGYENWKRDGVAESDKLHGILLKAYAEQYRQSWKLFRGSIHANQDIGLLNTIRHVYDSNRVYIPMGLSIDDRACLVNGELLEFVTANTSDGSGSSPFSSAFSIGFGSSGFN